MPLAVMMYNKKVETGISKTSIEKEIVCLYIVYILRQVSYCFCIHWCEKYWNKLYIYTTCIETKKRCIIIMSVLKNIIIICT